MKSKNGISLIVLVITVIVMVVLAGAIILTLNNSGIIQKASDAVDKTNEATIKEVAQLGWAEAYAEHGANQAKLEEGVKNALEKNNINVDEYAINVTTSGVTIKAKKDMWVKEGFTVVKGDKVLKIGETINYKAGVSSYTAGWKVLGADEEGNLLIMSAGDVSSKFLGDDTYSDIEKARQDWLNGPSLLDAECEPYGKGEGVVGVARSITVEDVNSVTGYDPETAKYGEGQLYQYGNVVTYSYSTTENKTNPEYTSVVTGSTPKALSNAHTKGFYYYNEKTGTLEHITDLATGERGKAFAELTSNYYYYYAPDLSTINATDNKEAFEMIFGTYDEDMGMYSSYYWLASPYVCTNPDAANFGLRFVEDGSVSNYSLWSSNGNSYYSVIGVRAVVTLASDIQITEKTAEGWNYIVN